MSKLPLKSSLAATWQACFLTLLAAAFAVMPDAAMADGVIGGTLDEVVGWFTGDAGAAIATLGVMVVGVGALMGKVSWGMALIVAIGVAVVFGAGTIVDTLRDAG